MLSFPNAKINLGLYVTGKRSDGYHNIESLFLPLDLKDALEILPADETELSVYGAQIPGKNQDNLILKAYHLLTQDFDLPSIHFHLLKHIPMGAGLGGGSANGAFALKLLNSYLKLGLSQQDLEKYAAHLGSDCIFFIRNEASYVSGRGERIYPCALELSSFNVFIISPQVHMSTKEAYQYVAFSEPGQELAQLSTDQFLERPEQLENGFEASFFKLYPSLREVKAKFLEQGAIYSSLTGSGSSFYGVFPPEASHFEPLVQYCKNKGYSFFVTTIL